MSSISTAEPVEAVTDAPLAVTAQSLMHSVLVTQARRWLVASGCAVILTEPTMRLQEKADVIGWEPQRTGPLSTLISWVQHIHAQYLPPTPAKTPALENGRKRDCCK